MHGDEGGGWGYWGGGSLRYQMTTHCQTAVQSRSSRVNTKIYRAVNSFTGQKGGRSTSTYAPYKDSSFVFVFTLFCEIHDVYYI